VRAIDKIIIHCSATKPSMDIGYTEIKRWHTDPKPKGNGWSDIGYHDVIRRDGSVESGRRIELAGAHTVGQKAHSIGICMVGGIDDKGKPESNFTTGQWRSLRRLVKMYLAQYPKATVHGHREFAAKACPSFSVQEWLKNGMVNKDDK
jgi:N-acetyl-anhydromuramyl-L-alanine amidase AmpD